MRPLTELLDQQDPALPLLQGWIDGAADNRASLLPPDEALRTETLLRLQVTTRSMLGAIAYETGGISIANGLLRLLGSGASRSLLRTAEGIGCPLGGNAPDIILVADDVLGGLFALNGGRFGSSHLGEVFYLAANHTSWLPLGAGYTDFVSWCVAGDLNQLYAPLADLEEFKSLPRPAFDATYSFYPFLWSLEAKHAQPSVRIVSAEEGLKLRLDVCGFTVG